MTPAVLGGTARTSLPQKNAKLLSIAGGGLSEDYNRAAGAPAPKWQGSVGAYVKSRIVSNFNASGRLDRIEAIDIIIPGDLIPAVTLAAGDTVTYTQFDPIVQEDTTFTGKVQSFSTPADLPSLPNYLKIALEDVVAP